MCFLEQKTSSRYFRNCLDGKTKLPAVTIIHTVDIHAHNMSNHVLRVWYGHSARISIGQLYLIGMMEVSAQSCIKQVWTSKPLHLSFKPLHCHCISMSPVLHPNIYTCGTDIKK